MGKTVAVVVIIILSLSCGALAWEVIRQQADRVAMDERLNKMQLNLDSLFAARKTAPPRKPVGAEMVEDLHAYLQSLDKRTEELIGAQKKIEDKIASLERTPGAVAKKDQTGVPPEGEESMSEAQREAIEEMVKKVQKAREAQFTNAIKSMVKKRFSAEMKKVETELDLTPVQKEEVAELVDKQIDKGFKAAAGAFEKGDMAAIREAVQKIVNETDTQLKEILDPDQIEKLKKLDPNGFGRREAEREKNQ